MHALPVEVAAERAHIDVVQVGADLVERKTPLTVGCRPYRWRREMLAGLRLA